LDELYARKQGKKMKITSKQLRKIIEEEVHNVLSETKMIGGITQQMGIGQENPTPQTSVEDDNSLFQKKQNLFYKLESALEEEDEDHWLKDVPEYEELDNLISKSDYKLRDFVEEIKKFLAEYGQTHFLEALR
jgi:hypothetical protein